MARLTERDEVRWVVSCFDLVLVELRERVDMMHSRCISKLVLTTATPLAGPIISL
jgi:hypothetical protein